MKKNVAGQSVGAQMITAADGTAFTGSVSVLVTIDNGTQTAGAGTAPAPRRRRRGRPEGTSCPRTRPVG